ncbi:MAG TPA: FHA domain-containing protein, partial [Kofleriaceae bacterium]|nr:FHA domain-containing protein [Kofleriaceae bacterium]
FCQHCGAMLPTAPGGSGIRPASSPRPGTGNDTSPESVAPTLRDRGAAADAMAQVRGGALEHMRSSSGSTPPPAGISGAGARPGPMAGAGPIGGVAHHPTPPGGAPLPSLVTPSPVNRPAPPPQPSRPASGSPQARGGERVWGVLYSVKRDGTDGEAFPLSGEWMEVGRQSADLGFDDRYLSTRHARLEQQPGQGCRIVPVDLLNGVFRKIRTPQPLPSGAYLLIGRELLRFEHVEEQERDVASLVRFGVATFGSPPRKPWGRLMQLLSNGGMRDVRHLHGNEVVLGREEGDIVFRDDEFLSRRHAVLRWQGTGCVVEDLKSSNGTFIRLRGPTALEHGDVLRMGDQMFRIELGGA